jgi:hypothetical protein
MSPKSPTKVETKNAKTKTKSPTKVEPELVVGAKGASENKGATGAARKDMTGPVKKDMIVEFNGGERTNIRTTDGAKAGETSKGRQISSVGKCRNVGPVQCSAV